MKGAVMSKEPKGFLTLSVLTELPWLVHGFGLASGSEGCPPVVLEAGFKPVMMKQVHSGTVLFVDRVPDDRPVGDALVSGEPGLLLVVRTADCLPVLLADPERRVVAAVHCGWRGTAARIAEKTLTVMASSFGTRPEDVRAALGPSIAGACYEVGGDVRRAFSAAGFPGREFAGDDGTGRFRLDLVAANSWLLRAAGVRPENIQACGECTHCRPEFYSYRREPGEKRRLHNFIGLKK